MLDPMLSLAFSMNAQKGGYALLLGSGISRAAGILTGYEIVLDLIRRIAQLEQEDPVPDPATWYQARFRVAPDYSTLLEKLANTANERAQLLTRYFEPTNEERQEGVKRPTAAHNVIAQLMARGYVRVVITTNFDRLLEQAMEVVGINPTVVSTADAAEGIPPLAHATRLVVKVNGDYLDTRIKNSMAELEQYDPRMATLLDRVFDEFGLVVCGWSGESDIALRAALERCKNRRYTTYWTTRRPNVTARTDTLLRLRSASQIVIKGGDEFFRELETKLTSLEEIDRPHPLTPAAAVATLKRYLPNDSDRIRLRDLVMDEARSVVNSISGQYAKAAPEFSGPALLACMRSCEAGTEIVRRLIAHGCYWAKGSRSLWRDCLIRLTTLNQPPGWNYNNLEIRYYPGLLALYAGGFAALCSGNYELLKGLFYDVRVRTDDYRAPERAVSLLHTHNVIRGDFAMQHLPGYAQHNTTFSDYLCALLRPELEEFLPNPADYEDQFDRFEYLKALAYVDVVDPNDGCAPLGRFAWRNAHDDRDVIRKIDNEVATLGAQWPPLRAGFFAGSLDRFSEVKQSLRGFMKKYYR